VEVVPGTKWHARHNGQFGAIGHTPKGTFTWLVNTNTGSQVRGTSLSLESAIADAESAIDFGMDFGMDTMGLSASTRTASIQVGDKFTYRGETVTVVEYPELRPVDDPNNPTSPDKPDRGWAVVEYEDGEVESLQVSELRSTTARRKRADFPGAEMATYYTWTHTNDADPFDPATLSAYAGEKGLEAGTIALLSDQIEAEKFISDYQMSMGVEERFSKKKTGEIWITDEKYGEIGRRAKKKTAEVADWDEEEEDSLYTTFENGLQGKVEDDDGRWYWSVRGEQGAGDILDSGTVESKDEAFRAAEGVLRHGSKRTAATAALTTGATHRVSGWDWDDRLLGFVAQSGVGKFACPCGSSIDAPGYSHCKCGKVWNSVSINGNRLVAREVPRRDMVLADKRTK
jgi:hypothetical protein